MPYTQAQLDRAVEKGKAAAARAPARRETRSGIRLERTIPRELYFNAVTTHGVDANDEGYWKDMERREPWIVPQYAGKIMVGARGRGGKPSNRHGRITQRFTPGRGWERF